MELRRHYTLLVYLWIIIFSITGLKAQQNVGIGTTNPNPKSVLDLISPTGNQGVLLPRLTTTQRMAMSLTSSENGMIVYDISLNQLFYWNGSTLAWTSLSGLSGAGTTNKVAIWTSSNSLNANTNIHWDNVNQNLGIGTSSPLQRLSVKGSFGIGGNYFSVFSTGLQSADIQYTLPISQATSANQVLTNDGAGNLSWSTPSSGLTGNGSSNQVAFWNNLGTALTTNTGLLWDQLNKQLGIGINPSTSTGKLQVNDASNSQGDLRIMAGTATGTSSTDGLITGINTSGAFLLNYEATPLTFGTGGITQMTISNTGNVGIGTVPASTNKLEVNGKTVTTDFQLTTNPGLGYVLTSDAAGNASWTNSVSLLVNGWAIGGNSLALPTSVGILGTNSSNPLSLVTGGVERVRVLANGNIGIGVALPTAGLHLRSTVFKYEDGKEGAGKVLVSDASGNASWGVNSNYSVSGGLNISTLSSVSTVYKKIEDALTFKKLSDHTKIELLFTSRVNVFDFNSATYVFFELRIDDLPTSFGTAYTVVFNTNNFDNIIISAMFPNLPQGDHKVSVWAKTSNSTATDITIDPGGYGGKIIVKETF